MALFEANELKKLSTYQDNVELEGIYQHEVALRALHRIDGHPDDIGMLNAGLDYFQQIDDGEGSTFTTTVVDDVAERIYINILEGLALILEDKEGASFQDREMAQGLVEVLWEQQ